MALVARMETRRRRIREVARGHRAARARFGDLPLSWKLLLPSVGLIVVLGLVGGFLIVRDLSLRSQAALDLEVSRRSLDVASTFRDRELSLIESANFASNLEGIADATRSTDREAVARLLRSVVALKTDLEVLAVIDQDGTAIVEFTRSRPGARPRERQGREWAAQPFVRRNLNDPGAQKHVGFVAGNQTILAIAAPVCSGTGECVPVGATIVGVNVEQVAAEALRRGGTPAEMRGGISVFDRVGELVASSGGPSAIAMPDARPPVRVNQALDGTSVTTLFTPLEAGGRMLGTLAVSIPVEPNLASVRRTALGLGLVLLAAMAGIAVIGIVVSRLVLRQVRSLVTTNRALGRGELSARANVLWNDEIGEVGTRLNEMAEQLQAMYGTLEARVAERTEEVERLLRERTEFFASVSHELRTPLAVILRHAEMLLDTEYRKNGRWSSQAGNALKDSGGQLARLIDDILQLAEAEAGAMAVDLGPVDLGEVIRDMRTTIEPLARAAGLRPSVKVPRDLPLALADEQRVRQIVLNLVDNAVKYTPEGGKVEVVAEEQPGWIELRVTDTGVGFPPDCGDRIFEPFYRVKGTEPQGGQASSGLGLAVAKRLVEAHGGRIDYRSAPGRGSTFTVRFRTVADSPRADRLEMKAHGRGRDA